MPAGLEALLRKEFGSPEEDPEMVPELEANPLLRGRTPHEYVFSELCAVRPAEREDALLALSFSYA